MMTKQAFALLAALCIVSSAGAATFTVTNVNDSGAGSLREAINGVVASADPTNTINFAIGTGVATIRPHFQYATLVNPVVIDGTTQPGYAGTPLVEIDGSLVTGSGVSGLHLGSNSTVKGLSIYGWTNGTEVRGLGSNAGIVITGNYNKVFANYIGVDHTGTTAHKNDAGIRIENGSIGNVIGGSTQAQRNIISGNNRGLEALVVSTVTNPLTGSHVIRGNWIGVSATGSQLPNVEGMVLQSIADTFVGGPNSGDGNLFSNTAIDLSLNGSVNVTVQGNRFGVPPLLASWGTCINVGYGSGNLIGGTTPGAGNTITKNTYNAIIIQDSPNNRVQGNSVINSVNPVHIAAINEPGSSNNNIVGGTAAGAGNSLRGIGPNYNIGAGVVVYGATGCSITGNTISNCSKIAIDLDDDGVTSNDSGDGDSGANRRQNFPVLTGVSSSGGSTLVTGTLNSTPSSTFRLEFFANHACNAFGYGDAETYVGSASVTTDGSGNAAFSVTLPYALSGGQVITATATDGQGNTSEVSKCAGLGAAAGAEISLASATMSVNEGNTTAALTVVRSFGAIGTATVSYATANGTASAGSDYTATSGTLTFAGSETSKTISIPILDDTAVEGNETFTVTLSAPVGATLGTPASATVTIIDNDTLPAISIADVQVTEGNSGTVSAAFPVTLNRASTSAVTVQWATANGTASGGSDYQSASGTVTFNAGETQKTIAVLVNGDTAFEPNETFTVELSSPDGATLTRASATGTIINDDVRPTITAADVRVVEGNSGTKQALITLTSAQPVSGSLTYATASGTAVSPSDYAYASGTVSFANETQQQIAVTINGDSDVESDEQFRVHLTSSDFAFTRADVTVTIVNDDAGIGPATQSIAKGSSGTIYVDIGSPASSPQSLAVSTSDPCITTPATVDIAAGAHTASFSVNAVAAPCTARVDVKFPPALGGLTLSATVITFLPFEVRFDPSAPHLMVGHEVNVHVTASPLDSTFVLALQAAGGTVDVPPSVTIDKNGGNFTLKALAAGPIAVTGTLPPQYGGGTVLLGGDVVDVPKVVGITRISPVNGPVAGGTAVTISGANLTAACTFAFGGVPAKNVAFASPSSMTATTPAHAAGTVDVNASCGADGATLSSAFTFLADPPSIHVVAPSFGSTDGGTTVHINGRNFQPGCWAFFDNVAARNVTVLNAVEMIANTPAHDTGSVPVSIRCSNTADAVLENGFTYSPIGDPAPVITSVDPLSAAPGDVVTISGARLRKSDSVSFDAAAAAIQSSAPEAHVVIVPVLPPGKVSVNVTDKAGRVSTTGPIFTILEAKPHVTTISPSSAPAGAELTIDGSGFSQPYKPALDGAAAPAVAMSYTRTVMRIPAVTPGAHEVGFVNGDGKVATTGGTVNVVESGIVIDSASPACGTTDGGTALTIFGRGFAAGATVTLGGIAPANVRVVDAGHITLTLPSLPPGFAAIVVTNPNGDHGTATKAVAIYSPFDPDGCIVSVRPRPIRR